ncbi:hypothetical protein BU065_13105 [Staphylococcus succinus]|uniref:hypothetical protein n=1 Tax=Staphylococcus succinus TaxID=61015 RepID=UPI0009FA4DC5|nr:hypothetical protein [Staphylococcus succinus]MEB8209456.1 hypothetical protein [Staphylococcus succinus]RIN23757.1 hypothetical protein BU066_12375 [Staphylococcus succinus]RIN30830.1 hypothetical protein BU065_13105 [Staphylococcus succinus]
MIVTILILVLIVNLLEALYLGIKFRELKKRNAADKEYKKLVDKLSPLMFVTFIISIVILVILWIIA